MPIEGEITVTLHWNGQRVHQVDLRSTRPVTAARLLLGRRPAEAVALVPRLFALCGHAQGAASAAALHAAGAGTGAGALASPSPWMLVLEALQETLWRLLIDAPQSLSLPPEAAALAPARAAVARAIDAVGHNPAAPLPALAAAAAELGALARQHVFDADAAAWLARSSLADHALWREHTRTLPARALAHLVATTPQLGRSDTALMPGLDDAGWWSAVVPALRQDPLFTHAPTWDGRPVETGALARQCRQPLLAALIARDGLCASTRFVARLVELATLLGELSQAGGDAAGWLQSWTLDDGAGLAAAQTARGLLLHHVRLHQGRLVAYRIVAPTEWNFHPQGALFRGIVGSEAPDAETLRARTRQAVQALDPCVGVRIEVEHHA